MTPGRIEDLAAQAAEICAALCSRPDILATMNEKLSSILFEIEEPNSAIDSVWDTDQRILFAIWINATAEMTSEVVNGNRRRILDYEEKYQT